MVNTDTSKVMQDALQSAIARMNNGNGSDQQAEPQ